MRELASLTIVASATLKVLTWCFRLIALSEGVGPFSVARIAPRSPISAGSHLEREL